MSKPGKQQACPQDCCGCAHLLDVSFYFLLPRVVVSSNQYHCVHAVIIPAEWRARSRTRALGLEAVKIINMVMNGEGLIVTQIITIDDCDDCWFLMTCSQMGDWLSKGHHLRVQMEDTGTQSDCNKRDCMCPHRTSSNRSTPFRPF